MRKRDLKIFLILSLLIVCITTVSAQRQTGSIKGKITDTEGFPLPGAFVYISSPALQGFQTYVTSDTGRIKFHGLSSGLYKIKVEMPGFKTVNIEHVVVRVGMTVTLFIPLEMSTVEEEITLKLPSPTANLQSAKIAITTEQTLIRNIPFARDINDIVNSASGIISEDTPFPPTSIVHGSTARANIYAIDGIIMNDPSGMHLSASINFDTLEEIEMETAAHPASVGNTDGGYINIVTKSGGNDSYGELFLYHSNDNLASTLISEEELDRLEIASPPLDTRLWDLSLSLAGVLMEDRAWFFGNGRFISQFRTTSFLPWTDPLGKNHEEFEWENREIMSFFKLTTRPISNLSVTANFHFTDVYRPFHSSSFGWNLPAESSRILDHGKNIVASGKLSYTINQNTFVDLKAGFFRNKLPLILNDAEKNNPQYFDEATGYRWGSARFNEIQLQNRFQACAYIRRFQDNFFGHHELEAGAEYENISGEWSVWKEDNLFIHYYFGSPYFYGLDDSPLTGNAVGKGKIRFYLASKEEEGLIQKNEIRRLSFFAQDSVTIGDILTLNLGIRFDRSSAFQLPFIKAESGNPLALKLGEELIEPLVNTNPYSVNNIPEWNEFMVWNSWSPRLGMILDLFGHGKSVFKASFSRYSEYMMLQYFSPLNPFYYNRSHQFFWYDENMDGNVDANDTFALYPEDYRLYDAEHYEKRIAPDINAPYTNEFTVGFQQELFPDFSFRVSYIYKKKNNIFENVLYDPDLDQDWYTIDLDTENLWIPFRTTVPGIGDYSDTPITVYFWSNDAPPLFDRVMNVPELERNYQALEVVFKKRMSHNWQMNGSLVLSRAKGNIGLGYGASSGFTAAANSPNYFVNLSEASRLDFERSLLIKLMGTYRFPLDIFLSFYYTHLSGTPWARRVTIVPPSSWLQKENAFQTYASVFLEEPGSRKNQAFDAFDIRIEKELVLKKFGRLSAYVDIINVLGSKYKILDENDGGYWFPQAEDTDQGQRVLSPTYDEIVSLVGARVVRLSLRFMF